MRKTFARLGYLFVAVIVLGLCLQVLLALRDNQPFYGANYAGLPLGTYSTLLVLILAGVIGVVRLVQLARARRDRKRK